MTDTRGVQVIAGMRPRVREDLESLCTPVASRAAHVDIGLFEEAGGGGIGDKHIAN